jgi:hypothetical protein
MAHSAGHLLQYASSNPGWWLFWWTPEHDGSTSANSEILSGLLRVLCNYPRSGPNSKEHLRVCIHYKKHLWNRKFWAELIAYFLLTRHGPHIKRRLQQLFVAGETFLPSCHLATIGGYIDSQTRASNNPSIVVRILCRGNVFTELLSSNERRVTHTDTESDGRDLWSTPFRWAQVSWYTYQVSWTLVQILEAS